MYPYKYICGGGQSNGGGGAEEGDWREQRSEDEKGQGGKRMEGGKDGHMSTPHMSSHKSEHEQLVRGVAIRQNKNIY